MKENSNITLTHKVGYALVVSLLFELSYFFIYSKIFGIAALILSLVLFAKLLFEKKYFQAFWAVLFVILFQNVLYGLFSEVLALFIGQEVLTAMMVSNKYWSYIMLEGKFLFVGLWCSWIFVLDVANFFKTQKVSVVRALVYLLALLLVLLSMLTMKKFGFIEIANSRNYFSLLFVLILGNFLGESYSNQLTDYFPRKALLPLVYFLSSFNLVSDIIMKWNMIQWNEIFGVHYLYFAKLFFTRATPLYMTAGRFFTDLFGARLPRSGGIFFEPVNYGFLLVFLTVLCAYYFVQTKKNIDLIAFILSGVFLFITLGKGALLTALLVIILYVAMKMFPARSTKVFAMSIIFIILLLLGVIYVAPLISQATAGHLDPFILFIEYVSHHLGMLPLGNGIGTAGNFVATAAFIESSFVVILAELGLFWYILYQSIVLGIARNVFTNTQIHPLLASFAIIGLLCILTAGTFQENVFSIQIGFFTVLMGAIVGSVPMIQQHSSKSRLTS